MSSTLTKRLKKNPNMIPAYGIWSAVSKKFVFGIIAPTATQATNALWEKIGTDAYKWRFEIKLLPGGLDSYIAEVSQ